MPEIDFQKLNYHPDVQVMNTFMLHRNPAKRKKLSELCDVGICQTVYADLKKEEAAAKTRKEK